MADDQQPPTLAKSSRSRLWSVLLALVIFVSGIGVGSGLTFKYMTDTFKRSFQKPEALADRITQRMKRKLDLTDEQEVKVRRILVEHLKAFHELRAKYRPLLMAQLEKTRHDLETVLTPEQSRKMNARFHKFLKFWVPRYDKGEQAPPAGSQ